jgi:SF-assemblin/beta giardin
MSSSDGKEQQPTTKERLSAIVGGFDEFDAEMKIGTRQRREKDEFRIAELKNAMTRLDTELVAEIKRRTEMNKSTQIWFEQNMSRMDKEFHTALDERTEASSKRIEELSERITELDEKRKKDRQEILDQIEYTGNELKRMLAEFKAEFEVDRERRRQREDELVRQLTDHEQEVAIKFENQIEAREARYSAIRLILEENIKLRDKAEERFQTFFEREIHSLHNSVRVEKEIREREDDEIVEALNRYTIKLQTSLQIINSTEM